MDVTPVAPGGQGRDSGENTVQPSSASVLRIQDSQLGMCLLPLCSVRFPEIWVLDLMTLEGLGAAGMWTSNDVWHPASLETKARWCPCPCPRLRVPARRAVSALRAAVTAAAEPGPRCGSRKAAAACAHRDFQQNEVGLAPL